MRPQLLSRTRLRDKQNRRLMTKIQRGRSSYCLREILEADRPTNCCPKDDIASPMSHRVREILSLRLQNVAQETKRPSRAPRGAARLPPSLSSLSIDSVGGFSVSEWHVCQRCGGNRRGRQLACSANLKPSFASNHKH